MIHKCTNCNNEFEVDNPRIINSFIRNGHKVDVLVAPCNSCGLEGYIAGLSHD
jgi:hypothetical protein